MDNNYKFKPVRRNLSIMERILIYFIIAIIVIIILMAAEYLIMGTNPLK